MVLQRPIELAVENGRVGRAGTAIGCDLVSVREARGTLESGGWIPTFPFTEIDFVDRSTVQNELCVMLRPELFWECELGERRRWLSGPRRGAFRRRRAK